MTVRQRQPRMKDEKHLKFVRQLPCVVCGNDIETEAAHVRAADPSIGKLNSGIGAKPDDCFVLPLCGEHHRSQHKYGDEIEWWQIMRVDPIKVALRLYSVTGDVLQGEHVVGHARQR